MECAVYRHKCLVFIGIIPGMEIIMNLKNKNVLIIGTGISGIAAADLLSEEGARFVSMAARSPAWEMAGPEVTLRLPPISFATIAARVVLPRPGGP